MESNIPQGGLDLDYTKRDYSTFIKINCILAYCQIVNLNRVIKLLKGLNLKFSYCKYFCSFNIWHNTIENIHQLSVIKGEHKTLL